MKLGRYEKGVIITGVAVLIIFLILLTFDGIKNIGKNKQNLALSEQEEVVPPNVPVLSAGMIPVKYEGDNLIICKNDNTWYNYEAGTPAYMMLNDGVYQSELVVDMTGKKLASKNIGQPVQKEEQGTIYVWISRFAINTRTKEIKYTQPEVQLGGEWETSDTFIYEQENEILPDFSLSGVWIEKTPLGSASKVNTKVTKMTGENNIYGFIANTIATSMATEENVANYVETGLSLNEPQNINRTMLKIINDKQHEPIKLKGEYNKETGLIEIQVTYSKFGIKEIILENESTENYLSFTEINGIITATTTGINLEIGTYTITITDEKENTKKLKIEIPLYYGREVINYECDVLGNKWRVFHKDEDNVYLIADDYIPYENLPQSTKEKTLNKNSDYEAYFNNILNDYTGSRWIRENTNMNAQRWISKYLNAYPNSTNSNMKAVAYMMDTESWSSFAGEKAEYAIGGPTIEMFCASYRVTHPNRYIEHRIISEYGYGVKYSDDTSYSASASELIKDDYNGIYIKSRTANALGMWIASPSYGSHSFVMLANYSGTVTNNHALGTRMGFRPVVCLKSDIKLIDNGDGETYSIREPIIASIEHKELDGTIEITVRYSENGIARIEDKDGNSISYTNKNGIIKAVTPAKGGRSYFTIIDNKGIRKELKVSVTLPIYATLYTDGTLAFTATDRVLDGKTVSNKYGDISKKVYTSNNQVPWYTETESITKIDIINEIAPISISYWFSDCINLTRIENISNLDTSNVTSMKRMFFCCESLTELDLSSFDTSNVTDMSWMFRHCHGLIKLDLSNFDTKKVKNMNNMFFNCNSLTELKLSDFNTSNVTDMSYMFRDCISLTELNLNNFNTSNVNNMGSMFYGCKSLTELDLSNFDTRKVTDMSYMFCNSSELKTIYVGTSWNLADNISNMFSGCGTSTTTRK